MTGTNPSSFLALNEVHLDLDEMFARHQALLVGLEIAAAATALDAFVDRLRLHMRHEEEWLLPIYAERGTRREYATRPQCEIYLLEHAKLLRLLGDAQARVGRLAPPALCSRRQIIAVLDQETTIKRVMEHHDERETSILYRELDSLTSASERKHLIDRCFRDWSDDCAS